MANLLDTLIKDQQKKTVEFEKAIEQIRTDYEVKYTRLEAENRANIELLKKTAVWVQIGEHREKSEKNLQ